MKLHLLFLPVGIAILVGCEAFWKGGSAETTPSSSASAPTRASSTFQPQWSQLTPGMAPAQVRLLLGSPDRTAKTRDGEVWYYGTDSVNFDNQEKVVDWIKR